MRNKYFYIIIIVCLFSLGTYAQENRQQSVIDGLSFYPNPVSTGKIYITSKSSMDKEVMIFDVLGKKVLQATISSKELNIATLSPGVYIIKFAKAKLPLLEN